MTQQQQQLPTSLELDLMNQFGIRNRTALVLVNLAKHNLATTPGGEAQLRDECFRLCQQQTQDGMVVRSDSQLSACSIEEEDLEDDLLKPASSGTNSRSGSSSKSNQMEDDPLLQESPLPANQKQQLSRSSSNSSVKGNCEVSATRRRRTGSFSKIEEMDGSLLQESPPNQKQQLTRCFANNSNSSVENNGLVNATGRRRTGSSSKSIEEMDGSLLQESPPYQKHQLSSRSVANNSNSSVKSNGPVSATRIRTRSSSKSMELRGSSLQESPPANNQKQQLSRSTESSSANSNTTPRASGRRRTGSIRSRSGGEELMETPLLIRRKVSPPKLEDVDQAPLHVRGKKKVPPTKKDSEDSHSTTSATMSSLQLLPSPAASSVGSMPSLASYISLYSCSSNSSVSIFSASVAGGLVGATSPNSSSSSSMLLSSVGGGHASFTTHHSSSTASTGPPQLAKRNSWNRSKSSLSSFSLLPGMSCSSINIGPHQGVAGRAAEAAGGVLPVIDSAKSFTDASESVSTFLFLANSSHATILQPSSSGYFQLPQQPMALVQDNAIRPAHSALHYRPARGLSEGTLLDESFNSLSFDAIDMPCRWTSSPTSTTPQSILYNAYDLKTPGTLLLESLESGGDGGIRSSSITSTGSASSNSPPRQPQRSRALDVVPPALTKPVVAARPPKRPSRQDAEDSPIGKHQSADTLQELNTTPLFRNSSSRKLPVPTSTTKAPPKFPLRRSSNNDADTSSMEDLGMEDDDSSSSSSSSNSSISVSSEPQQTKCALTTSSGTVTTAGSTLLDDACSPPSQLLRCQSAPHRRQAPLRMGSGITPPKVPKRHASLEEVAVSSPVTPPPFNRTVTEPRSKHIGVVPSSLPPLLMDSSPPNTTATIEAPSIVLSSPQKMSTMLSSRPDGNDRRRGRAPPGDGRRSRSSDELLEPIQPPRGGRSARRGNSSDGCRMPGGRSRSSDDPFNRGAVSAHTPSSSNRRSAAGGRRSRRTMSTLPPSLPANGGGGMVFAAVTAPPKLPRRQNSPTNPASLALRCRAGGEAAPRPVPAAVPAGSSDFP